MKGGLLVARRYEMAGRSAAKQRTRESILDAAVELFTSAWFDEVTMADIAQRAGVSQQTVVNHFGTKIDLYLSGLSERYVPSVLAVRGSAEVGDVRSIVATVVEDYEVTGDGTVKTLATAARAPELQPVVEGGRQSHHDFVRRVFAPQLSRRRGRSRERLVRLLAAVLDVRMWQQLRREEGLDVAETRAHLESLVEALLGS
jgi:AcrR family transcriptional regulator